MMRTVDWMVLGCGIVGAEQIRTFEELEGRHGRVVSGADSGEVATVAPYGFAPSDATLTPMDEPERIDAGGYEVYRHLGYTIQRSDQPGYTDRWFVYRERRPFRALLRGVDQELVTFGSLSEAVAWLTQNPDALPELNLYHGTNLTGHQQTGNVLPESGEQCR